MIEQVTDVSSQINQLKEVLSSVKMINFVPIYESSFFGNICLFIGLILGNLTLSWNQLPKSNGYGRDRAWQIRIGIMWTEFNFSSKESMDY